MLGAEEVIKMGMVSGGLAGGVEASGAAGEPEGVSGDTRPLGAVDIVQEIGTRWRGELQDPQTHCICQV